MLQVGMRGSDVRALQADLSYTGFATRVTGFFNGITKSHVVAFQRRFHLSVDGVVGPQTAHVLLSTVAKARRAEVSEDGAAGLSAQSASGPTTVTPMPAPTPTPTPASDTATTTGGTSLTAPPADSPAEKATLNSDGLAVAPPDAPAVIREIIAAANNIAFDPYIYGGGHASFTSSGYDCSGSVSYALHGGGLLSSPLDSTEFENWGTAGKGRWMTLWANGGHVYAEIAGLFFDTAAQSPSNNNDRWSPTRISPTDGFIVRHPTGW